MSSIPLVQSLTGGWVHCHLTSSSDAHTVLGPTQDIRIPKWIWFSCIPPGRCGTWRESLRNDQGLPQRINASSFIHSSIRSFPTNNYTIGGTVLGANTKRNKIEFLLSYDLQVIRGKRPSKQLEAWCLKENAQGTVWGGLVWPGDLAGFHRG